MPTAEVQLEERHLLLELFDVGPTLQELVLGRLDMYLRPREAELFGRLERELEAPVPFRLHVRFTGSPGRITSPDDWHEYLPAGDREARQTMERALVQIAASACAPGPVDVHRWHRAACRAIRSVVDPVFVCTLEHL